MKIYQLLVLSFCSLVLGDQFGVKTVESDVSFSHLFAGSFERMNGIDANNWAIWRGDHFEPTVSGGNNINSMVAVEGGVFVVGGFTSIGGIDSSMVAFFDTAKNSWCPVLEGLDTAGGTPQIVVKSGSDIFVFGNGLVIEGNVTLASDIVHYRKKEDSFSVVRDIDEDLENFPGTIDKVVVKNVLNQYWYYVLSGDRLWRGGPNSPTPNITYSWEQTDENLRNIDDFSINGDSIFILGNPIRYQNSTSTDWRIASDTLVDRGNSFEEWGGSSAWDPVLFGNIDGWTVASSATVYWYGQYRETNTSDYENSVFKVTDAAVRTKLGTRFPDGSITGLQYANSELFVRGTFANVNEYIWDGEDKDPEFDRFVDTCYFIAQWDDAADKWIAPFGGYLNAAPTRILYSEPDWFFAGGGFSTAYNSIANNVALYNDEETSWTPAFSSRVMGRGNTDGFVIFAHQMTEGSWVFGGNFEYIGEATYAAIVGWSTDKTLSEVGGGLWDADTASLHLKTRRAGQVFAIETTGSVDEGIMYVGGQFSQAMSGNCLSNIARLPSGGKEFEPFGGAGCDGPVYTLLWSGDILYIGGAFQRCGFLKKSQGIAAWEPTDDEENKLGGNWIDMHSGVQGQVLSMVEYDGDIYVAGSFTTASYLYSPGVARWNGENWEAIVNKVACSDDCPETANYFNPGTPIYSLYDNGDHLYGIANDNVIWWDDEYWQKAGGRDAGSPISGTGFGKLLSGNDTSVLVAGGEGFLQVYQPDYLHWVDPSTSFDNTIYYLGGASQISFGVLSLFAIYLFI